MNFTKAVYYSIGVIIIIALGIQNIKGQSFERENFNFLKDSEKLQLAGVGGFNCPQLLSIDVNNDGIDDIVIYDRDVDYVRVLVKSDDGSTVTYSDGEGYESFFPSAVHFMITEDFNSDGISDLFVGNYDEGVPGIYVYEGYYSNDKIHFKQMIFPDYPDNLLRFKSQSGIVTPINTTTIDLPSFHDVDQDGDLDILHFVLGGGTVSYYQNLAIEQGLGSDTFSLEITDNCWGGFYENDFSEKVKLSTVIGECASFGRSQLRHSGSTITSFDQNNDGLNDLLIGDLTSNKIVYLENGGTRGEAFITFQDENYPSYDESIDLNLFLASFLVKIDGDNHEDLVIAPNAFNGSSTQENMLYYKNVSDDGTYIFEKQEDFFLTDNYLDVSANSVPALVDVNGDELLDLVIGSYGDVKNNDRSPSLYLFLNIGTKENPIFDLVDKNWLNVSDLIVERFSFAPSFGDINGDGYIDMILGDNNGNIHYFENNQSSMTSLNFKLPIIDYKDIDVSSYAIPQIVDLNEDGLGDLLIGEQNGNAGADGKLCGSVNRIMNIGTVGNPDFSSNLTEGSNTECWGEITTSDPNYFRYHSSPFAFKIGDSWHTVVGGVSGRISSYRNIDPMSDLKFDVDEFRFGDVYPGKWSHPVIDNLDDDPYLEMVIGHKGGGIQIYETNWKIDGTVPVSEVGKINFQVFPNPSGGEFEIQSSEEIEFVEMYDIQGKLILKDKNVGKMKTFYHSQNGIYFIRCKIDKSEKVYNHKLMINK